MTDEKPLVSIGMPVYNGAKYIREALDSLLAQDYANFELIICDNNSEDETQAICLQYARKDERISYFRNAENVGAMKNFERVVELSSGSFFMWAAADDFWSSFYISSLVDSLSKSDGAILASGWTRYVKDDAQPHPTLDPDRPPPSGRFVTAQALLAQHASSWIYGLYNRSLLKSELQVLREQRAVGGDMVFLLFLCLNYQLTGNNEATIYKRVYGHNDHYKVSPQKRASLEVWYVRALLGQVVSSSLAVGDKRRMISSVCSALNQGGQNSYGKYWLGILRDYLRTTYKYLRK